MYQAVHNQFVACAKIMQLAIELIRMLSWVRCWQIAPFYPATCRPKDVILTMKKNRMQYYFSDVQLRGEYPVYALRYFKDRDIHLNMQDGVKRLLKTYTMDFLAVSYLLLQKVVDSDKNAMTPLTGNKIPFWSRHHGSGVLIRWVLYICLFSILGSLSNSFDDRQKTASVHWILWKRMKAFMILTVLTSSVSILSRYRNVERMVWVFSHTVLGTD